MKTRSRNPRENQAKGNVRMEIPTFTHNVISHAHTASPRPLARTHDTNTKRNRNQFPDWGSLASINSPQSPIYMCVYVNIFFVRTCLKELIPEAINYRFLSIGWSLRESLSRNCKRHVCSYHFQKHFVSRPCQKHRVKEAGNFAVVNTSHLQLFPFQVFSTLL